MKLPAKVVNIFDSLVDFLAAAGAALIVCAMLIVCLEVVMRYVLHRPQIWVVEIAEYILVWFTFLAATWILKGEGHVKVDILVNRLNPRTQALLGIISSIIGIVICLLLVVYGTQVTWDMFLRGSYDPKSQIGMPKAFLLVIIPICSFPLLIQFVRRGYGYFEHWKGH